MTLDSVCVWLEKPLFGGLLWKKKSLRNPCKVGRTFLFGREDPTGAWNAMSGRGQEDPTCLGASKETPSTELPT